MDRERLAAAPKRVLTLERHPVAPLVVLVVGRHLLVELELGEQRTADQYGGAWDHVPPPKGDLLGPGSRIPALVISPFAKMGTVDHTQYDTASILRLVTRRFDLEPLPGIALRDHGLDEHSELPMGDLTNALDLTRP